MSDTEQLYEAVRQDAQSCDVMRRLASEQNLMRMAHLGEISVETRDELLALLYSAGGCGE